MNGKKKIAAAVVAVVVVLAAVIGFCLWRQSVSKGGASASGDAQTSSQKGTSSKESAKDGLTDDEIDALLDVATRFEHAARDWGVDPVSASSLDLSKQDAQTVLDQVRTPDSMDRSALDQLTTIPTESDQGPEAPSVFCQEDSGSALCDGDRTTLEYWRDQNWTMGSRVDNLTTDVNDDGTVSVSGDVRYILWSNTKDAAILVPDGSGYWGYSPATGLDSFKETLTIKDGKVTARDSSKETRWMGDPWFSDWTDNPSTDTESWDDRQQPNIPLKGTRPDLPLDTDVTRVTLKNSDDITTNPAWNDCIQELGLTGNAGVDDDDQYMSEEEWERLFG